MRVPFAPAFLEHSDAIVYFDECLRGIVRARRCEDAHVERAYKVSMLRFIAEDVQFHNGNCTLLEACLEQISVTGDTLTEIKIAILQNFLQHYTPGVHVF